MTEVNCPNINSDATKKSWIDTYHKVGVSKVLGVFSMDEINRLRKAALQVLTQLPAISSGGYRHAPLESAKDPEGIVSPALVFWPCLANSVFDKLRTDERLRNIAMAILGSDIKQLNNQFYYRMPGDGDSFSWHQDIMFRYPLDAYPGVVEEGGYLQTAIVVDKMTLANSPIIFIEGSHLYGNLFLHQPGDYSKLRGFHREQLPEDLKSLKQLPLEAEPGDVLVWSALTIHGSETNRSNDSRMYYMNGFARTRNAVPWPHYCVNRSIAKLDPRLIP